MDILGDIVIRLFSRAKFSLRSMPRCAALIQDNLANATGLSLDNLSIMVCMRLSEEAYIRAKTKGEDGSVRFEAMFREVDLISQEAARIIRGEISSDDALIRILDYYKLSRTGHGMAANDG